jgi:NAD(P) transhydrogenase subunit alpha
MSDLALMLGVFAVSFGIGHALISKVPPVLHTPLMSMTNALSAITLLGALLLFAVETGPIEKALGAVAIACAAFNAVGGFAVTDLMVRLFKKK